MIWLSFFSITASLSSSISIPNSAAFLAAAIFLTFSIGSELTAAKPATTVSNMSLGILANSSLIISLARWPLIFCPSPRGKQVTRDLLIRITQRSTSRLGPLLASHILLNTGALFQIVSIYSNRTLDCRKAAPTTTTFRSGKINALSIEYNDKINDLPKPRLAISMGNFLFHISHRNRACDGKILMLNICLHKNEKYSGLVISQSNL